MPPATTPARRAEADARSFDSDTRADSHAHADANPRDPDSRAYYDRKRAAGKKHNAALICLARRRCDVLYAMLRHHTPYQATTPAAA